MAVSCANSALTRWLTDRKLRVGARLGILIGFASLTSAGPGCGSDDSSEACAEGGGDSDDDKVCDADDNCPTAANSDQADADKDGEGDACDQTPQRCDDVGGDADADGVCDNRDNCIDLANPTQRDEDNDGRGDVCDPVFDGVLCRDRGGDPDGDSICQVGDNCPDVDNPDQLDADHDGQGDGCDTTPMPCDEQGGDADDDTICDRVDNCVDKANANQLDRDRDGVGDLCDAKIGVADGSQPCAGIGGDDDDDDWCGIDDNCPTLANKDQKDTDRDGIGDVCDQDTCDGLDNDSDGTVDEGAPDADGDGHADCIDPCPTVADGDQDGDKIADCADACPLDPLNDADRDSVCDSEDNCRLRANYGQSDRDNDGVGDSCDAEQCDGISNDEDTSIDEGMPDEDGDGVCDEIDRCKGDPRNDFDGDGICFASDTCPDTANVGDRDSDRDGIGDVCDLDARCDPAVPVLATGAEALPQLTKWPDIVVSPDRQTLYALAGPMAVPYASEFLAIDLASKSIKWRLVLGGSPSTIELSSDGTRAWVILAGARSVRMIDLVGRRRCGEFSAWSDTRTLMQPTRLAAIPGVPGSLVVVADAVTRIYDEGRPRTKPITNDFFNAAPSLVAADERTVYSSGSYNGGLTVHTIGPQGFESAKLYPGVVDDMLVKLLGGRLYTAGGSVIDPTAPKRLADLPVAGTMDVDLGRGEIYYSSNNNFTSSALTIQIWNAHTFAYTGQIPRTGSPTYATVRRLLRFGSKGLVALYGGSFATDNDVLWIIDDIDAARTR